MVYSLAIILITGLLFIVMLATSFSLGLVSLTTLMMTAEGQEQQPSSNATTATPSNATITTMLGEDPHCLTFREEAVARLFAPVGMEPSESVAIATIDKAYNQVFQGTNGILGTPISGHTRSGDGIGYFRHFERGSIYYSPDTCAHAIHGAIREKWASMGGERSCLGYPTSDEMEIPDGNGRFNQFQYGYVSWSRETREIHDVCKGRDLPISVVPGKHNPSEADRNLPPGNQATHPFCNMDVAAGIWKSLIVAIAGAFGSSEIRYPEDDPQNQDVSKFFPSWPPVNDPVNPAVLEGEVVFIPNEIGGTANAEGAHLAYEDTPISHYTHDFTFHVKPDVTLDKRYTNILGEGQSLIEVEWESGVGQNNDDWVNNDQVNSPTMVDIAQRNQQGQSGGFFSTGHNPGETFWNWPTIGDHVHVEGNWVWDRGHEYKTEIHPPRLVAVQRHLLSQIVASGPDDPRPPTLATRGDVFASGDGGALWNNRESEPGFVEWVPMGDRDYSFTLVNKIPRPSQTAMLHWLIQKRPGDTFTAEPVIERISPNGADVKVTIPWRSSEVSDNAVFARTIYLYWGDERGQPVPLPDWYHVDVLEVALKELAVYKHQDFWGHGDYRLFGEVGGNWFFFNELFKPIAENGDVLNHGLGETSGLTASGTWTRGLTLSPTRYNLEESYIRLDDRPLTFRIYVPPGDSFRVHAGGWEADGTNMYFGRLKDPRSPCDNNLKAWLNDNFFTIEVFENGSKDDPIGEVNSFYSVTNGFGIGPHTDERSEADEKFDDAIDAQDGNPDASYSLTYHIQKLQ